MSNGLSSLSAPVTSHTDRQHHTLLAGDNFTFSSGFHQRKCILHSLIQSKSCFTSSMSYMYTSWSNEKAGKQPPSKSNDNLQPVYKNAL
jgi:hypothetical protein